MKGELSIQRIYGNAELCSSESGDPPDDRTVRVRVLAEGHRLIQFSLSIEDFARAVMGTSGVLVDVEVVGGNRVSS